MRPILLILACVLVLNFAGCNRSQDPVDDGITENSVSSQPLQSEDEEGIPVSPRQEYQQQASLAQGAFTIFGLTLPKGMTPSPGPSKVYRFESRHSADMMFENIERQVSAKKIEPEGDGYLIREASVRNPEGKATGDEIIAVRINKRHKGGCIVDVWLEKSYANRARLRDPSSLGLAATPKQKRKATRAGTTWKKNAKESRREAIKVMGKISRKEKLTAADLKSSAFH